jgi:hypothetical protein
MSISSETTLPPEISESYFDFCSDEDMNIFKDLVSDSDFLNFDEIFDTSDETAFKAKKMKRNISNPTDDSDLSEETKVLLSIPGLMIKFVNSGNLEELDELINNFFTKNCSFQTISMPHEEFGRDGIINLIHAAIRTNPDLLVVLKKVTFNKRLGIIKGHTISSGTKQFVDRLDYMYHVARYAPPGSIDAVLQKKALDIENSGHCFQYLGKATWIYILNADLTLIQKVIFIQKPLDISEAPDYT